jgi:hypothetical protein
MLISILLEVLMRGASYFGAPYKHNADIHVIRCVGEVSLIFPLHTSIMPGCGGAVC